MVLAAQGLKGLAGRGQGLEDWGMNVEWRRQAAGVVLRATLSRLLRDSTGALDDFDSDALRRAHFIRTRMKRLQSLSRLVPKGASWHG